MPPARVRNARAQELQVLLRRSSERLVQLLEEDGPGFLLERERTLFVNYASDLFALKSVTEYRESEARRLNAVRHELALDSAAKK